jgi:RNA polymerase sigma-70 factor (ECF subfamily)
MHSVTTRLPGTPDQEAKPAGGFRDAALPHLDAVYTFARYLLREPVDAENAVQACYVRALHRFETLRASEVKPWLFAILRDVCRVEYGSCSRVLPYDIDAKPEELEGMPRLRREAHGTPGTEIVCKSNAGAIRGAVIALPDVRREIVVLREVDDLSYREIATIVGAPVSR